MTDYIPLQGDAWETSKLAYAHLLGSLKKTRGQVATQVARYTYVHGWDGLTDKEIEDICTKVYGIRGARTYAIRRIELSAMGLVKWTGDTRQPKTVEYADAQEMNVWRIVTPHELDLLVAEANCHNVSEYIELAAQGLSAKKKKQEPTVDDIAEMLFELRTYPPVYVAKKIHGLFNRSCT